MLNPAAASGGIVNNIGDRAIHNSLLALLPEIQSRNPQVLLAELL
jgi:hypothetical protein